MYNQFLNRVTENTKIVHGKTFIHTDKQLRPVLYLFLYLFDSNPVDVLVIRYQADIFFKSDP